MTEIKINLIVIRAKDLEVSKEFYETLGMSFSYEQHGQGEKHLSTILKGTVFEIYPCTDELNTSSVRLGFQVSSVDEVIEELQQIIEVVVISSPKNSQWGRRAVILDPDGQKIELLN